MHRTLLHKPTRPTNDKTTTTMAIAKECKQVHGWAKVHFEIGSEAGDEDFYDQRIVVCGALVINIYAQFMIIVTG